MVLAARRPAMEASAVVPRRGIQPYEDPPRERIEAALTLLRRKHPIDKRRAALQPLWTPQKPYCEAAQQSSSHEKHNSGATLVDDTRSSPPSGSTASLSTTPSSDEPSPSASQDDGALQQSRVDSKQSSKVLAPMPAAATTARIRRTRAPAADDCASDTQSTSSASSRSSLDDDAKIRLLRLCGGDSDLFVLSQRYGKEIKLMLERGQGSNWCTAARGFVAFSAPRPNPAQLELLLSAFSTNLPRAVALWNGSPTVRELDVRRLAGAVATELDRKEVPVKKRWPLFSRLVRGQLTTARKQRPAASYVAQVVPRLSPRPNVASNSVFI